MAIAVSIGNGARAVRTDLRLAFGSAPRSVFPPDFRAQRERVTRALPPGQALLHISAAAETWYSRLWQRSLYPRNVVIVVQPPFDAGGLHQLRAKYAAHFAISAGAPPVDPGYRSRISLGPLQGQTGDVWFGELAP